MNKNLNSKPVFYDPTGKRWRRFLVILFSSMVVLVALLLPVLRNNLSLYAAKSTLNNNIRKEKSSKNKKTLISYGFSSKEFSRYRENYKNIDTILLDLISPQIDENGFIINLKDEYQTENFDKFLLNNNLNPSLFLNLGKSQSQPNFLNRLINKHDLYVNFNKEISNIIQDKNLKGINLDLTNIDLDLLNKKNLQSYLDSVKDVLPSSTQMILTIPYNEGGKHFVDFANYFDEIVVSVFQKYPNQKLEYLNQYKYYLDKIFSKYDSQKISILIDPRSYLLTMDNQYVTDFEYVSFAFIGDLIEKKWTLTTEPNNNNIYSTLSNTNSSSKYHLFDSVFFYNFQYTLTNSSQGNPRFGLSNIGSEDPMIWKIINNKDFQNQQEILKEFLFDTNVISLNNGDLVISSSKLVPGQRELIIKNNYITDWSIKSLPKNPRVLSTSANRSSVALTFDDGPDPVYTPQVLNVLKEKGVKGVFFVTGENVEKFPDIANQIVDEGHLIANHTYDHPRTYTMSDEEFIAQIESTQNIIEEVTGVSTKYFRIPFSDSSSIENIEDLRRYKILEQHNLQAAHYDVDSKDWELNDSQKIVDLVLSHNLKNSSQLLFHDGGSDRSSTVEALPAIIDEIHNQGLKIVTIDQFTSNNQTGSKQEKRSFSLLGHTIQSISSRFIWYYLLLFSILTSIRYFGLWFLNILKTILPKNNNNTKQPLVSILIPCYNEENTIVKTVQTALNSDYPSFEVIVVDDGSKDSSLKILQENFTHNPKVQILSIANSGKAGALNTALKIAKGELILSIDADTLVYPDTLKNLVTSMDSKTGAVAGNIQVGNDYNLLTKNQRLEYINGQNFDKIAYGLINGIIVVPGALGLWRKKAIEQAGGYQKDTLAEDADLTIRLYKNYWKVKYNSQAIAITEAPDTVSKLIKQRVRWMYGILQVIFKNKDMLFNPQYKLLGIAVLPEVLFNIFFLPVTLLTNIYFIILFIKAGGRLLGYSLSTIPYLNYVSSSRIYQLIIFFLITYTVSLVLAIFRDKSKNKWSLILQIPYSLFVYRNALWMLNILVIFKVFKGRRQTWNHFHKIGQINLLSSPKKQSELLTQSQNI